MWRFLTSLISAARQARAERGGDGRKRIWMIGPMPPPLNGQSNYNKTILAFFRQHAPVTLLPTGASAGEKLIGALVLPFVILFAVPKGDHVYTSPPGQNGLWLFMATILALRIRRLDHFVHHHSFRAINLGPTRSGRALATLGGRYQRHVFLSETMMQRYAALYLSPEQQGRSFVLPNAYFFFSERPAAVPRSGPVTIGHLSVITREKGIGYLMTVIDGLVQGRQDFRFVLAGPIREPALEAEVKEFCARHASRVAHIGPVLGDAKDDFYRQLDLFVLPSKLIDEADPLVLLEAFGYGCDVVASSVGCIPERVIAPDRLMTFDVDADILLLDKRISAIKLDRVHTAAECLAHGRRLRADAQDHARRFFEALDIAVPGPDAGRLRKHEIVAAKQE